MVWTPEQKQMFEVAKAEFEECTASIQTLVDRFNALLGGYLEARYDKTRKRLDVDTSGRAEQGIYINSALSDLFMNIAGEFLATVTQGCNLKCKDVSTNASEFSPATHISYELKPRFIIKDRSVVGYEPMRVLSQEESEERMNAFLDNIHRDVRTIQEQTGWIVINEQARY